MPTTEDLLRRSIVHINSGVLHNEADVKQFVILQILRALDWDDGNPDEFASELRVENALAGRGYVDYALKGERGPLVFIEAKAPGKVSEGGEEQVFAYAYQQGAQFLVLTDGNIWAFYLPNVDGGAFADRKFYHMELRQEEKVPEYVHFLNNFLHKNQLVNNTTQTRRAAEDLRDGNIQQEKARNAIPTVWQKMLEDPDASLLRSMIVEAVESECGTQPDLDDVESFLCEIVLPLIPSAQAVAPTIAQTTAQPSSPSVSIPPSGNKKIVGFVLDGTQVDTRNGKQTLTALLKEFNRRDTGFMDRFSQRTIGRNRRLVARNRDDLYDKAHLRNDHSLDLENGWWLGTNLSTSYIRNHIETACQVMDIQFGSQLTLIER
ncbi:MAG: hypothetical protein OXL37_09445 [Chloroflexota bacterium]|nr:hypothetical protein [Chloroflexota bacterium]MDE2960084.1 hypothetical protein [Chloroflexota bacterium]